MEATLTGDSAAPSWSYELAGADDGAHFVRVFSRDAAGNDSPGLNGRFTIESGVIDTTAPSVSLDSPEQNATVAAPVTIGGTATDDIGVASVELIVKRIDTGEFWNGSAFQADYARVEAALAGDSAAPSWSYELAGADDGAHFVRVFSRDAAGNDSPGLNGRFTIESGVIDTTAPSVSLDSPEQNATVAAPVTIGGTATDDIAVTSVELIVKRIDTGEFWNGSAFQADYARVEATLTGDSAAPSWSYELAGADDGAHFVRVFSRDAAGNDSPGLNGRFTIDAGPDGGPTATIDPLGGGTLTSLPTVSGTATDDVSVDRVELVLEKLDNGLYWDPDEERNGYYPAFKAGYRSVAATLAGAGGNRTWTYEFDFAIDGDYRLSAVAIDNEGNAGEPAGASVDFTIVSTGPSGNLPNLSGYQRVFREDFDGSSLDPTKWRTSYYWGPYQRINNEKQLYVDTLGLNAGSGHDPFEIADGKLKIVATPVGGNLQPPAQPPADDPIWSAANAAGFRPDFSHKPDYDPANVDYLSGVITSIERFDTTHGYFEATGEDSLRGAVCGPRSGSTRTSSSRTCPRSTSWRISASAPTASSTCITSSSRGRTGAWYPPPSGRPPAPTFSARLPHLRCRLGAEPDRLVHRRRRAAARAARRDLRRDRQAVDAPDRQPRRGRLARRAGPARRRRRLPRHVRDRLHPRLEETPAGEDHPGGAIQRLPAGVQRRVQRRAARRWEMEHELPVGAVLSPDGH